MEKEQQEKLCFTRSSFDNIHSYLLHIPAVQLVNKEGICKLVSNNDLKIMVISAAHWLSLLP